MNPTPHATRLLLAGPPGGELRLAADLARHSGAFVTRADSISAALESARLRGGDLAMVDVQLDIATFIASLRSERIAMPVIACGIEASAERAVAAIRAGARDYVPLPPDRDLIAAAILSVTSRSVALSGESPAFRRAVGYALAMARSNAPMLVRGEPGTGKELVARTIHHTSSRNGPFVTVECAAMAPDMLESELFGHAPGSFPEAQLRRTGRLEEAANGTLLLRHVDALPGTLQARVVDLLASGQVVPIGEVVGVPLSARLIASTSEDLPALAAQGRFRSDLLHRLRLIEIVLPPLRERGDDIALLAGHFARQSATDHALPPRTLADAALALLGTYAWPDNVRELEAMLHRSVLLASSETIGPADLVLADGTPLASMRAPFPASASVHSLVGHSVAEVERDLILHTLDRCQGNRTSASSILGISVRTMRNKLREFAQTGYAVR